MTNILLDIMDMRGWVEKYRWQVSWDTIVPPRKRLSISDNKTRGPLWPWNRSSEPSELCGIAVKSRNLNHNPLFTNTGSSMI